MMLSSIQHGATRRGQDRKQKMANIAETHNAGRLPRLGALFAAVSDALARRKVFRKTYAELNALSMRELEDLGISRSMITRLAHEAAYKK